MGLNEKRLRPLSDRERAEIDRLGKSDKLSGVDRGRLRSMLERESITGVTTVDLLAGGTS